MPFDEFEPSEPAKKNEFVALAEAKEPGTVLKPFHGPLRRFPVDYVVVEADTPDLPISMDVLKAKGFIA